MKKVLAIALFAAATVGASAQYSAGDTWTGGTGAHMFGPAAYTNNASGASATSSIATEVVQNASIHYLNKPIKITSAMNVGQGAVPTSQGNGVTPTFFLIQGQTATFEDFQFEIRGSERSTIDVAWSVTGDNGNVDITAADASINAAAEVNGTENVAGNQWTGSFSGVSFKNVLPNLDSDNQAPFGWDDLGKWFNQYDATGAINVGIDFSGKAINEPGDDGFPSGAGDPTTTGTRFDVKVDISNYELVGSDNFNI